MATIYDELWNLIIAFRAVRIETAKLDAEVLLMHALGIDRTQLLTSMQDDVTPEQQTAVASLANRRLEGEPVAYIVGSRECFGIEFAVNPSVLIPRPETELLVEWALDWLNQQPNLSVIDIGTGSGAIAIAVAVNSPETVQINATDVSPEAIDVARANADKLAPDRIRFVQSDLLNEVAGRFDLILANLPYLTTDQISTSPSIAREPRLALDGGVDGAELIYRLLDQVPDHLAIGGATGLELDPSHAIAVAARVERVLPDYAIEIRKDLAGLDRFVLATPRI